MKKSKITLSINGNACNFCKMPLNTLEEQKSGSHQECQEQVKDYQETAIPKIFTKLAKHYNLFPTFEYELNEKGEVNKINLSGQAITEFPPKDPELLKLLEHLEELDLSNNPLENLSENLAVIQNLKVLNIHACPFRDIPAILQKMSHLEMLSISNDAERLPKWFIQKVFDGLEVHSASILHPDLQYYGPLILDADVTLFNFQEAASHDEINQENALITLSNMKKQLQDAVTNVTQLMDVLSRYPDKNFGMQEDIGILMLHGETSIIKELFERNIVSVWCQNGTDRYAYLTKGSGEI